MVGTNATISDDDVMIDIEGFYSDHSKDSHQEPTTRNKGEGIQTNNSEASISLLTAMDVDKEQHLKVSHASGIQSEISQVNVGATPTIISPQP